MTSDVRITSLTICPSSALGIAKLYVQWTKRINAIIHYNYSLCITWFNSWRRGGVDWSWVIPLSAFIVRVISGWIWVIEHFKVKITKTAWHRWVFFGQQLSYWLRRPSQLPWGGLIRWVIQWVKYLFRNYKIKGWKSSPFWINFEETTITSIRNLICRRFANVCWEIATFCLQLF